VKLRLCTDYVVTVVDVHRCVSFEYESSNRMKIRLVHCLVNTVFTLRYMMAVMMNYIQHSQFPQTAKWLYDAYAPSLDV